MKLLDILSPKAIKVPLTSHDKKSAIEELVDLLAEASLIEDAPGIKAAVWVREQQRTTGIGDGLAIPHAKAPCSKGLVMAIGRPEEPIDFDAIDQRPVQLVILLISPPDRTSDHIRAMGKISRLMADEAFRARAYAVESNDALYTMLVEMDA